MTLKQEDIKSIKGEKINFSLFNQMRFFESHLYWFGWVGRKEIVNAFNISSVHATHVINEYKLIVEKHIKKDNLCFVYNNSRKRYEVKKGFKPLLIKLEVSSLIELNNKITKPIPICDISQIFFRNINIDIMRSVCFAITTESLITCDYISLSSGQQKRTILPTSIFYDGIKTYIRGYCFNSKSYKDFCLSRIVQIYNFNKKPHGIKKDLEWEEITTVRITTAKGLNKNQREAIERDFNMEYGCIEINLKKPLLYYFTKRFNLDSPHKDPLRQQIILAD